MVGPSSCTELLAFRVLVVGVRGVGRASRACRLMALLTVGWGGLGDTGVGRTLLSLKCDGGGPAAPAGSNGVGRSGFLLLVPFAEVRTQGSGMDLLFCDLLTVEPLFGNWVVSGARLSFPGVGEGREEEGRF